MTQGKVAAVVRCTVASGLPAVVVLPRSSLQFTLCGFFMKGMRKRCYYKKPVCLIVDKARYKVVEESVGGTINNIGIPLFDTDYDSPKAVLHLWI